MSFLVLRTRNDNFFCFIVARLDRSYKLPCSIMPRYINPVYFLSFRAKRGISFLLVEDFSTTLHFVPFRSK